MGWKNDCHHVQLLNTIDTNKIKMMKGIPSVDFNPHDDLILDLLNDSGKHVYHIVMASGEEKWFLELDYVNMPKPTTIYFDINDAKLFLEKVGQSLKEQKGEGFNPKNTILNPGERSIDHILMGFPQHKQKGSWHIMLDNGLNRLAEIYFSQKDADTFNNKMNQSFAAAL
jgi:hypothetical protein